MIQELIATFSSRRLYNEHLSDINPQSLTFILENGYEKMVVMGQDLCFVPGNGVNGQVLKKGDGYIYWDDLNSIKGHNAVNNLGVLYSTYIIQIGSETKDKKDTIKFVGSFVKGQSIELYITKDPSYEYPVTIAIDSSLYKSLSGKLEFEILENEWTWLRFISDGETVYVDSKTYNSNTKGGCLFEEGWSSKEGSDVKFENSIMASNGTTETKNAFEASVGKFNASSRETATKFGVGNTVFTVGNGLDADHRHSALKVYQNGNIGITDMNGSGEYYEKPEIILQDVLTQTQTSDGSSYGANFWVGTQTEYDNISNKTKNTFYFIKE